jgi:hypothetical protein
MWTTVDRFAETISAEDLTTMPTMVLSQTQVHSKINKNKKLITKHPGNGHHFIKLALKR